MCRWFTLLSLQYLVYLISAFGQEERNSLIRPIHPRRHKRTEQVRRPVVPRAPFVIWKNDLKCMTILERPGMACPKKNVDDPLEKTVCIEPYQLCDDMRDCPGADDEEPHFCMFKKLEDAELRKLESEIILIIQNKEKQRPEFKDVIVNNDDATATTVPATPSTIQEPIREGIFRSSGLGKANKQPAWMLKQNAQEDMNKTVEESEEEEEEEDEEEENEEEEEEAETKKVQHPRRRTTRHLFAIRAIRL
ncbi:unnamed protein product [Caenorhabditis nigoni]